MAFSTRAYEIHEFGINNLRLVTKDLPNAGPDEVIVRLRAAALNYRDVMVIEGTYNPKMKLPAIPFSDAAGEVVEVGSDVSKWNVGDRVCSTVIPGWVDGEPSAAKVKTAIGAGRSEGVLKEYGLFHQDSLIAVPAHLSFIEAATLPCAALTAWHALVVSGDLKAGDTVLTLGTGGVSVFALQFAKMLGAVVVITSSSDEKLERARALGADHVINYQSIEDWENKVYEITGGRGVDHVIEVGGTGTLTKSIKSVRNGGHVALIGALDMSGGFNPVPVFMRNIRVQGIFVGSRMMFESMNASIVEHQMKPVVDRIFEFEKAREALDFMKSGSHFGKIVIEI